MDGHENVDTDDDVVRGVGEWVVMRTRMRMSWGYRRVDGDEGDEGMKVINLTCSIALARSPHRIHANSSVSLLSSFSFFSFSSRSLSAFSFFS